MTVKTPRRMPTLTKVAMHWSAVAPQVFPNVKGSYGGWGEPFCFRCGWLSPIPAVRTRGWDHASGWLQRAHLQDRAGGGSDSPENIVPLCALCHEAMPSFPDDPSPAIEWVRVQHSVPCSQWWQLATDLRWGGDKFQDYPGRKAFYGYYVQVIDGMKRAQREWDAKAGAA